MIRALIVDDNAVIRHGIRALLELDQAIEVVGEAANGREACATADELKPDVVLLDVRMPVLDGLSTAERLAATHRVIMVSYAEDEPSVTAALRAGAKGYLVHGRFTPEELQGACHAVMRGEMVLSPAVAPVIASALRRSAAEPAPRSDPAALTEREEEILALVAQGLTNGEIAERLVLAEKTVKNHLNRIYPKLGVTRRAQAIARWLGTDATPGTTSEAPRV